MKHNFLSLISVAGMLFFAMAPIGCRTLKQSPPAYGLPPENESGGAAAIRGTLDVPDSPYYRAFDFYHGSPTKTLLKLDRFQTSPQCTEYGCGAVCARMTLKWLGCGDFRESELIRRMDIRDSDNRRPDGGYGCTPDALIALFRKHGLVATGSPECPRRDGISFETPEIFSKFLRDALCAGAVVLLENVAWGGHWVVAVGYDTMGTPDCGDDVLIFADPYDTSDHCQDGWTIKSFDRFFYEWLDAGVLTPGISRQPFVIVRHPASAPLAK